MVDRDLKTVTGLDDHGRKNLVLSHDQKSFAGGEVPENFAALEPWTNTRMNYLNVLAEYNKTQFAMIRALGLVTGGQLLLSGRG